MLGNMFKLIYNPVFKSFDRQIPEYKGDDDYITKIKNQTRVQFGEAKGTDNIDGMSQRE